MNHPRQSPGGYVPGNQQQSGPQYSAPDQKRKGVEPITLSRASSVVSGPAPSTYQPSNHGGSQRQRNSAPNITLSRASSVISSEPRSTYQPSNHARSQRTGSGEPHITLSRPSSVVTSEPRSTYRPKESDHPSSERQRNGAPNITLSRASSVVSGFHPSSYKPSRSTRSSSHRHRSGEPHITLSRASSVVSGEAPSIYKPEGSIRSRSQRQREDAPHITLSRASSVVSGEAPSPHKPPGSTGSSAQRQRSGAPNITLSRASSPWPSETGTQRTGTENPDHFMSGGKTGNPEFDAVSSVVSEETATHANYNASQSRSNNRRNSISPDFGSQQASKEPEIKSQQSTPSHRRNNMPSPPPSESRRGRGKEAEHGRRRSRSAPRTPPRASNHSPPRPTRNRFDPSNPHRQEISPQSLERNAQDFYDRIDARRGGFTPSTNKNPFDRTDWDRQYPRPPDTDWVAGYIQQEIDEQRARAEARPKRERKVGLLKKIEAYFNPRLWPLEDPEESFDPAAGMSRDTSGPSSYGGLAPGGKYRGIYKSLQPQNPNHKDGNPPPIPDHPYIPDITIGATPTEYYHNHPRASKQMEFDMAPGNDTRKKRNARGDITHPKWAPSLTWYVGNGMNPFPGSTNKPAFYDCWPYRHEPKDHTFEKYPSNDVSPEGKKYPREVIANRKLRNQYRIDKWNGRPFSPQDRGDGRGRLGITARIKKFFMGDEYW